MLFYQRIVALSDQSHAGLRMRAQAGFRYAAATNSVPILAGEAAECARHYPIVFASGENGLVPAVLLGLRAGENLFVGANGSWGVPSVPAFIRRYPFLAAKDGNGRLVVCIDEAAGCFSGSGGEPLFAAGVPGPTLTHAMQFLNEFQEGAEHTQRLSARIAELGLLREADSLAQLKDGTQFRLGGIHVVEESRLGGLADADVVGLFRAGALQLVHLHLHSLGNLAALVDRLAARQSKPARPPARH